MTQIAQGSAKLSKASENRFCPPGHQFRRQPSRLPSPAIGRQAAVLPRRSLRRRSRGGGRVSRGPLVRAPCSRGSLGGRRGCGGASRRCAAGGRTPSGGSRPDRGFGLWGGPGSAHSAAARCVWSCVWSSLVVVTRPRQLCPRRSDVANSGPFLCGWESASAGRSAPPPRQLRGLLQLPEQLGPLPPPPHPSSPGCCIEAQFSGGVITDRYNIPQRYMYMYILMYTHTHVYTYRQASV